MKVGEILFKQGFVEEGSIKDALKIQSVHNKNIGEILVDIGAVQKNALHEALSFQKTLEMDRYENKVNFLENNMPFSQLARAEIEEIAESMEWETYLPKHVIFLQDKEPDKFIVLKSGLVKVCMMEDGREIIIGFLGEGECFGVLSMFSNPSGTPKYEVIEEVLCLSQRRMDFIRMVQKHLTIYNYFLGLFSSRINNNYEEFLASHTSSLNVGSSLYKKQVKDTLHSAQIFCSHNVTMKKSSRGTSGE